MVQYNIMRKVEQSRRGVYVIAESLSHLPELSETLKKLRALEIPELGDSPEQAIAGIYIEYLRTVRDLATLREEDIALIRKANAESTVRGISKNSAAHGGADYFLDTLDLEGRTQLLESVLRASNPESPEFVTGLQDLVSRMTAGHDYAIAGVELVDGASEDVDKAIHGHTKGLQPYAMVHFVLCHFLERVFTAVFSQSERREVQEMVKRKDTLLAAMGDVIRLRKAQGKAYRITPMWEHSRAGGGLQWNKKARQDIFDAVVLQHLQTQLT